jgi:glucosamine--fructose-6-phosphate aminotransferase (isomerizing)
VVALTGQTEGRLAQQASHVLSLSVPTLGFSPGTSTYVAMLVTLYLLAAELARAAGRTESASLIENGLRRAPELAGQTVSVSRSVAEDVAGQWSDAPVTTFLGAGPSRASAAFGAAKLFEGPQRWGIAEDLEEWAHLEYFVSGPATPIVVIAPTGASRDRATELISEMAFVGAPVTLVSDVVSDEAAAAASLVLPVAPGLDEALSPLLTCLPLALSVSLVAKRLGSRSYGFPTAEREREHYETIHRDTRGAPA